MRWTGTKGDLLSRHPRPRREEETQTRGQAAAGQERGGCGTDLARPAGPPFPNPAPEPSCAGGKAGHAPAELSSWAAALHGSSPPVSQAKRDFSTPPGHVSAEAAGRDTCPAASVGRESPRAAPACQHPPDLRCSLDPGLRVSATKIHPFDWKSSSAGTPGTGSCHAQGQEGARWVLPWAYTSPCRGPGLP